MPVFVSVIDCEIEIVPCVRSGKVSDVGESETTGAPPTPEIEAVAVVDKVVSVTVSVVE